MTSAPYRYPDTTGTVDHCRHCGYRVTVVNAEWLAEDDTACCAGRGEWGDALPHEPRMTEVSRDVFMVVAR